MKRSGWASIFGIILVLFALAGCEKRRDAARDYETSSWPLKTFSGWVLHSPHYRIYTTVKDTDFQVAVVKLAEGQYERFRKTLILQPKEKMTVYIFANVSQWLAFTESKFGDRASSYTRIRNGGYTVGHFAAFYYLGRFSTLTILAHELFHLYLNSAACPDPVPAWMNEGMACFFEAHEWDVNTPEFTPRKNLFRRESLSDALTRKKLFPFKELLATNAGEITKLPQQRVLIYYAQLWALMEFLEAPASGRYHANFLTLLSELGTRKMALKASAFLATVPVDDKVSFGEAVFRQYITNDLEEFEAEFLAYLPSLVGWE